MADETGLDFSDQISSLESKYQQVFLKGVIFYFFLGFRKLEWSIDYLVLESVDVSAGLAIKVLILLS